MADVSVEMWQKDGVAFTYTVSAQGIVEVSGEFMESLMSNGGFERTTPEEFWHIGEDVEDDAACTDPECCP